jgi:O-antigen polymerase
MSALQENSYNKLFLYLSLLLWVFLVHYYQQFEGGGGLSAPFNSTTWIGVSLIVSLGIYKITATKCIYLDMQDLLLLVLGILLAMPFLWSDPLYAHLTYDRYFAIFIFVVFVALIKQFKLSQGHNDLLYLIIVISGVIESALAIFQFISPSEIDLYLFGVSISPAYGIFQQPNLAGSFIATTVALSLYLQVSTKTLSDSCKLFLKLAFSISISAIILTGSRTAMLGTILSIVGLTWVFASKEHYQELIKIWVAITLGVLMAFSWYWLNSQIVGEFHSFKNPLDVSERWAIYKSTLAMILEHPFAGWGLGSFQPIFMERLVSGENQSILDTHFTWTHPHNELLFLAFEGGILPVLATISITLIFAIKAWRAGSKSRRLLLVIIPVALHTMTEFPLYESVPHLILMAILLAHIEPFAQKNFEIKMEIRAVGYMVTGLIPIIVIPFMVTNLYTTYLFDQFWKNKGNPEYLFRVVNIWGQEERLNVYTVMSLSSWGREVTDIARYEMSVRPSRSNYLNLMNSLDITSDYNEIEKTRNIWSKNWKLRQNK